MLETPEFRLSEVDCLADEIDLLFKIFASARVTSNNCARLWLSAIDLRRETAALCRDIERTVREAGTHAIDPVDRLTDRLLASQVRTQESIKQVRSMRQLLDKASAPFWVQRWMLRRAEKEMLTQHRLLGLTRIVVMEHDADSSPVLDGEFDSAESLLEALRRNAA